MDYIYIYINRFDDAKRSNNKTSLIATFNVKLIVVYQICLNLKL